MILFSPTLYIPLIDIVYSTPEDMSQILTRLSSSRQNARVVSSGGQIEGGSSHETIEQVRACFSIKGPRDRVVSNGQVERGSSLETLLEQLPDNTRSKAASAPRDKDCALIFATALAAEQAARPLLASRPLHAPMP